MKRKAVSGKHVKKISMHGRKLSARLGQCCVELDNGTVLGLSLAKVQKVGQNWAPKTVPQFDRSVYNYQNSLVSGAEGNKPKQIHYSWLKLNILSFVLYPSDHEFE